VNKLIAITPILARGGRPAPRHPKGRPRAEKLWAKSLAFRPTMHWSDFPAPQRDRDRSLCSQPEQDALGARVEHGRATYSARKTPRYDRGKVDPAKKRREAGHRMTVKKIEGRCARPLARRTRHSVIERRRRQRRAVCRRASLRSAESCRVLSSKIRDVNSVKSAPAGLNRFEIASPPGSDQPGSGLLSFFWRRIFFHRNHPNQRSTAPGDRTPLQRRAEREDEAGRTYGPLAQTLPQVPFPGDCRWIQGLIIIPGEGSLHSSLVPGAHITSNS
jgi:hypothetical protein